MCCPLPEWAPYKQDIWRTLRAKLWGPIRRHSPLLCLAITIRLLPLVQYHTFLLHVYEVQSNRAPAPPSLWLKGMLKRTRGRQRALEFNSPAFFSGSVEQSWSTMPIISNVAELDCSQHWLGCQLFASLCPLAGAAMVGQICQPPSQALVQNSQAAETLF